MQDARPPFDIHAYGERILDKLSSSSMDYDDLNSSDAQKPFTCIVAGLEKHEVARIFAALLQLVNKLMRLDVVKYSSSFHLASELMLYFILFLLQGKQWQCFA